MSAARRLKPHTLVLDERGVMREILADALDGTRALAAAVAAHEDWSRQSGVMPKSELPPLPESGDIDEAFMRAMESSADSEPAPGSVPLFGPPSSDPDSTIRTFSLEPVDVTELYSGGDELLELPMLDTQRDPIIIGAGRLSRPIVIGPASLVCEAAPQSVGFSKIPPAWLCLWAAACVAIGAVAAVLLLAPR